MNVSKSKSKIWVKSGVNEKDSGAKKSTPMVFGSVYSDK
jgi:hypothetical protein